MPESSHIMTTMTKRLGARVGPAGFADQCFRLHKKNSTEEAFIIYTNLKTSSASTLT